MNKKIAIIILAIFIANLTSGCWSRRELNELAIVLGTGVDLTDDGKIRLTLQIAKAAAFGGAGEGGGGGQQSPA